MILLLVPAIAVFGRFEERPAALLLDRRRPPAQVAAAVVVVFLPAASAAVNGLTLGLLGAAAACFLVALAFLRGVRRRARPGPLLRGRVQGQAVATGEEEALPAD